MIRRATNTDLHVAQRLKLARLAAYFRRHAAFGAIAARSGVMKTHNEVQAVERQTGTDGVSRTSSGQIDGSKPAPVALPLASTEDVGIAERERLQDFASYDPLTRIVTLDGIRYSRDIFESLGRDPNGTTLRIIERQAGRICLQMLPAYDDLVKALQEIAATNIERETVTPYEVYRRQHFGAYSEYPIEAATYFGAGYHAAQQPVPVAQWEIITDEDVLIYVVHPNAAYEPDEKRRREQWEGWFCGRWIKHNSGGWTWHGMLGAVTHVAALPARPDLSRAKEQGGV
jgi:hypothetical protein